MRNIELNETTLYQLEEQIKKLEEKRQDLETKLDNINIKKSGEIAALHDHITTLKAILGEKKVEEA